MTYQARFWPGLARYAFQHPDGQVIEMLSDRRWILKDSGDVIKMIGWAGVD